MELVATKRDITKNAKAFRKAGLLPAVVYGRSQESTPITVPHKAFEKVFHAAGESSVITLTGIDADLEVLIHEVSVHPVSGTPIHADFYAIEKGQTVTVSVPLEFDGVSLAVREMGGILVKVMHELEMEVLPKDLPHAIAVDISKLVALDSQIKVSDLQLPASAKLNVSGDEIVAMIDVAKEEVEEVSPMDISQIGVSVEKGKKEEAEGTDEGSKGAEPKE
ncbi:MAG: 50S ribosomal protein L25 [bacterium]|nr:50S ribosomal protein L25 [bacterium]